MSLLSFHFLSVNILTVFQCLFLDRLVEGGIDIGTWMEYAFLKLHHDGHLFFILIKRLCGLHLYDTILHINVAMMSECPYTRTITIESLVQPLDGDMHITGVGSPCLIKGKDKTIIVFIGFYQPRKRIANMVGVETITANAPA